MIYLFNLGITIISCISIAMIDFYPKIILNNHFRNHLIIFMLKLFIISGAINFTFFHILEGVVSQKLITKK